MDGRRGQPMLNQAVIAETSQIQHCGWPWLISNAGFAASAHYAAR
jgi:hypothetical protein